VLDGKVLIGRHGPCPGCGGKDRLRFDDIDNGMFYCSGGGAPLTFW
jgi:putative DNA primase/helicase